MKTIVNNLFAMLLTISAFANGNPAKTTMLIENEKISISINEVDVSLFNQTTYDAENENLAFDLNDEVTFVQIFDGDNELMFQLPVMSNKLKIGSSLFGEGQYKLGFMMKGTEKIHFTNIVIN